MKRTLSNHKRSMSASKKTSYLDNIHYMSTFSGNEGRSRQNSARKSKSKNASKERKGSQNGHNSHNSSFINQNKIKKLLLETDITSNKNFNISNYQLLINNANNLLENQTVLIEQCSKLAKSLSSNKQELDMSMKANVKNIQNINKIMEYIQNNQINNMNSDSSQDNSGINNISKGGLNDRLNISHNENKEQCNECFVFKNFIMTQLNGLNELIGKLGFNYVFHKFKDFNFNKENIETYFQNTKQLIFNINKKKNDSMSMLSSANDEINTYKTLINDYQIKINEYEKALNVINLKVKSNINSNNSMGDNVNYKKSMNLESISNNMKSTSSVQGINNNDYNNSQIKDIYYKNSDSLNNNQLYTTTNQLDNFVRRKNRQENSDNTIKDKEKLQNENDKINSSNSMLSNVSLKYSNDSNNDELNINRNQMEQVNTKNSDVNHYQSLEKINLFNCSKYGNYGDTRNDPGNYNDPCNACLNKNNECIISGNKVNSKINDSSFFNSKTFFEGYKRTKDSSDEFKLEHDYNNVSYSLKYPSASIGGSNNVLNMMSGNYGKYPCNMNKNNIEEYGNMPLEISNSSSHNNLAGNSNGSSINPILNCLSNEKNNN